MEQPRFLDPNPEFLTENLSSLQMNESLLHLAARAIDSITVDGYKLISVDHIYAQHGGGTQVICRTEAGSSHLFFYDVLEEGPVAHMQLDHSE